MVEKADKSTEVNKQTPKHQRTLNGLSVFLKVSFIVVKMFILEHSS